MTIGNFLSSTVTLSFLHRCILATLIVLPAAHAGAAPPAAPAKTASDAPAALPAAPSKVLGTTLASIKVAAAEIDAALWDGPDLARNLDALVNFRHTPATAQALIEATGHPQPWRIERRGVVKGQSTYRFVLQPVRHARSDGIVLDWSEMPIDFKVDASGRKLISKGAWPRIDVTTRDRRFLLSGISFTGDERMGKEKIWYGKTDGSLKRMEISAGANGKARDKWEAITLHDLRFTSQVDERPNTVDITQRTQIARIAAFGIEVKDLTLAYRFLNLDKQALSELGDQARKEAEEGKDEASSGQKDMLGRMVRAAVKSNSAIVFDRISASYAGHAATMSGRLNLAGVQEAELDNPTLLFGRVEARFDVAVPLALIKAVNLAMVKRDAKAEGETLSAADANKMAQSVTDLIVTKLKTSGYVQVEKGVLRASIVLSGGQLTSNGKPVNLPGTEEEEEDADASEESDDESADEIEIGAELIEESCTAPNYPADVIEHDKPFKMELEVDVDEDGDPVFVKISQRSKYRAYDRELEDWVLGCKFKPGTTRSGEPGLGGIFMPIERKPGELRPRP